MSRFPDVIRVHEHDRIGAVDAGDPNPLDEFAAFAGGEDPAGQRTQHIEELEQDRGRGSRHAVDAGPAFELDALALRPDMGMDPAVRVGVVDPDQSLRIGRLNEPSQNRKRSDSREDVAAVGGSVHDRLVHRHLGEQVLHIAISSVRGGDDRDLACEAVPSAQTIDLARIRGEPMMPSRRRSLIRVSSGRSPARR